MFDKKKQDSAMLVIRKSLAKFRFNAIIELISNVLYSIYILQLLQYMHQLLKTNYNDVSFYAM